jgi:iron complex transport system substrate-binding protein
MLVRGMQPRPRIVTLLPAATEIVAALGRSEAIVGRSHECDYPPGVERLPVVTRPRSQLSAVLERGGAAIHATISDLLARALSIYEVDVTALAQLAPDVIVTQAQCAACAIDIDTLEEALREIAMPRPRLVSLTATSLAGVLDDIGRIAEAVGSGHAAAKLCESISQRLQGVTRRTAQAPKTQIACLEWLDPLMGAGNWMPELALLAGGELLFGTPGQHTPSLDLKNLHRSDPPIILAIPCGFNLDRAERELSRCWPRLEFQGLQATRSNSVFVADGQALFNRPGPRLVESLQVMAEILHPELCRFGHEGRFWRRFSPPARV